MTQYFFRLGLVLVLLAWIPALSAQTPTAIFLYAAQQGTPWSALSSEEQNLLSPHQKRWQDYAPGHQERLRKGAHKYLRLSPHEQKQLRKIRGEYQRKSPEERRRLRETYRRQHLKK